MLGAVPFGIVLESVSVTRCGTPAGGGMGRGRGWEMGKMVGWGGGGVVPSKWPCLAAAALVVGI